VTTDLNLQVNRELSQSKHGSITNIDVVIRHSAVDVLQQRLQQPAKHISHFHLNQSISERLNQSIINQKHLQGAT